MSDPTPLTPGPDAPASSAGARSHAGKRSADASGGAHDRSKYAVAINRGYGDAMGRGLELALTLVVMGGLGWLVDRIVGTYPLFLVIFGIIGFAGISAKLWLGYDLEMRKLDQDAVWSRGTGVKPTGTDPRGKAAG